MYAATLRWAHGNKTKSKQSDSLVRYFCIKMEEYIEDEEINKQNESTDVNENDATMLKNVETGNPFINDVGGDGQAGLSTSANEKGENSVETLKKDPSQNQSDIPRNTPPPDYKGDAKDLPVDGQTAINESDGNDKAILASGNGDNFWLVGNYKRVVKKIEDGAKLCEEISQMMSERAEIESLYAKKLKGKIVFEYKHYTVLH